MPKIQSEARLPLPKSVGELKEVLERAAIPDEATVNVNVTQADRPYESSYSTLVFRWEKEV